MSLFRSVLWTFMALLLVSCGGGGTSSDSSGVAITRVVAFGDSIGVGFNATTNWPSLLGQKLGVLVVNNSVVGQQVPAAAAVVDAVLAAEQPSHMVVLLGTNDARNGTVDGAVSRMNVMVQAALRAGVVPIIGTVPVNFESEEFNAATAQISSGYQQLPGAKIANVRGALGNDISLFPDGLHPDDRGQEIIATAFRNAF